MVLSQCGTVTTPASLQNIFIAMEGNLCPLAGAAPRAPSCFPLTNLLLASLHLPLSHVNGVIQCGDFSYGLFPLTMVSRFIRLLLVSALHLFSYLFKFLNWRIIAVQNLVVFCHTSASSSHKYTHVPSLPSPSPTHPPACRRALFEFPQSYSEFPLAIYLTYGIVNFYVTLSVHLPFSLNSSHHVHRFIALSLKEKLRNQCHSPLQQKELISRNKLS